MDRSDGARRRTFRNIGQLIHSAARALELDLRGATVLTEAATREFAATSVLAAAAGARVLALTRDSGFGGVDQVRADVHEVAARAGVDPQAIEIVTDREALPSGIDVITNLGFVRPVNLALLEKLSPTGVVSYMCEDWELRPEDVDLDACRHRGVPVAGVWEEFDGLGIFRSCGPLAVKMCFEAGLEVAGNRVAVLSPDRFGPVIGEALASMGAHTALVHSADALADPGMHGLDGIVVADYTSAGVVLPPSGGPNAAQLAAWNPGLVVVQFAGRNDVGAIRGAGISAYPDAELKPRRMGLTLAHLGARPVVYLHAAGLKVGELLWRERRGGMPYGRFAELVQPMVVPAAGHAAAPAAKTATTNPECGE